MMKTHEIKFSYLLFGMQESLFCKIPFPLFVCLTQQTTNFISSMSRLLFWHYKLSNLMSCQLLWLHSCSLCLQVSIFVHLTNSFSLYICDIVFSIRQTVYQIFRSDEEEIDTCWMNAWWCDSSLPSCCVVYTKQQLAKLQICICNNDQVLLCLVKVKLKGGK